MPAALTRRAFFRFSLERLAFLTVAGQAAACTRYVAPGAPLAFLDAKGAGVLRALVETMVPQSALLDVALAETSTIERIDRFLAEGDPLASQQLRMLLTGLEHYPQLFTTHFVRFTKLSSATRIELLGTFADSRFYAKRMIFTALKSVVCNHYYADRLVQERLGYAPSCRF